MSDRPNQTTGRLALYGIAVLALMSAVNWGYLREVATGTRRYAGYCWASGAFFVTAPRHHDLRFSCTSLGWPMIDDLTPLTVVVDAQGRVADIKVASPGYGFQKETLP